MNGLTAAKGIEDVDTLLAMNNLANVYLTEKSRAGHELLKKALDSLKNKVGGKHPASLIAMNNLAIAYNVTGKRQEAEELWKDTIGIQRRVLGDDHPDTLITKATLGGVYMFQGRSDEAEKLLLETLKGCRAALDRNHLATDACVACLSVVYINKGELKKAKPYLIEAMEITRARYGPEFGLSVRATEAVGSILVAQKERKRPDASTTPGKPGQDGSQRTGTDIIRRLAWPLPARTEKIRRGRASLALEL